MGFNIDLKSLKSNKRKSDDSQSDSTSNAGNKVVSDPESGIKKFLRSAIGKRSFDNEKILGVDITPHYVRICQLKNSYGKWMLTNLASACMENLFRKTDIMVNPDTYAENLKDLISKNKIKSKNVSFTVPTSSSIVKVLKFADMSDEDFHEAAKLGAIWESAVTLEGGASEYQIYYKILRHNPAKQAPQESTVVPLEQEPVETSEMAVTETMPIEEQPIAENTQIPVEAPVGEIPQQQVPAETPIADATTEPAPQTAPIEEQPIAENTELPVEAPVQEMPQQEVPAEIPVADATAEPTPQETPIEEQPIAENPEMPVEAPVQEMPQQEAPAEIPVADATTEPPPQAAPIEEQPVAENAEMPIEAPVQEMPQQEVPAEIPVADATTESAPQAAPIEEQPVADATTEPVPETSTEIPEATEIPTAEPIPSSEPVEQQPGIADDNNEEDQNKDPNTMAEAEGAPAFEESAVISEEIQPETEIEAPIEETPLEGPTMDVLFIATKTADVDLYADIITKAGLRPVLADVRCLALKHALESHPKIFEEIREPYAFLEFGPDDNYVFVVDGEKTDIYPIFMSEDDIMSLIYSAEDIEKMKVFVQNYANQALQIIKDHQENHRTDAIIHLFAISSAPLHVNDASSEPTMKMFVREMKQHMTGRTVKECDFCSHIEVPEKFAKQVNAEGNISAWATTVGIATRKLDIFDTEKHSGVADINLSNLLPSHKTYKDNKIKGIFSTFVGIIMMFVFAAGLGASFLSLKNKNVSLETEIQNMSDVESIFAQKSFEEQQLKILTDQVDSLGEIQKSLPSNQPGIIKSFMHISESYPEGIILNEVKYKSPNKLTIKGISVNDHAILSFVKRLNSESGIMKVALRNMETEENKKSSSIPGVPVSPNSIKNFTLTGIVTVRDGQGNMMEILGKEDKNGN